MNVFSSSFQGGEPPGRSLNRYARYEPIQDPIFAQDALEARIRVRMPSDGECRCRPPGCPFEEIAGL
jgi:hypothetical protein